MNFFCHDPSLAQKFLGYYYGEENYEEDIIKEYENDELVKQFEADDDFYDENGKVGNNEDLLYQ